MVRRPSSMSRALKNSAFSCEKTQLGTVPVCFAFNNEVINKNLTFAKHDMKNGDHLNAHFMPTVPANNYMESGGKKLPSRKNLSLNTVNQTCVILPFPISFPS
jgi:hypothetical protein